MVFWHELCTLEVGLSCLAGLRVLFGVDRCDVRSV